MQPNALLKFGKLKGCTLPLTKTHATMPQIQYKSSAHPLEFKESAENEKVLHIKAYVAVFGNVDSYGDVIKEGAFDDFLKSEDAKRMKLCYQHNSREVIGVITNKGVDQIGLWIEADILDTTTGLDVQKLIKAGAVDEFSIGYYADKWSYEKREGYDYQLRILEAVTVVEASPVTRAANPKAILLDAKNEGEMGNSLSQMSNDDFRAVYKAVEQEYARRVLANL